MPMVVTMTNYYETNADEFVRTTQSVDMSAIRDRFISVLPQEVAENTAILDAGTGSGRDAAAFKKLGYRVAAFDASPSMVKAATAFSGIPVRLMPLERLEWEHRFHGIWACASLLHVSRDALPDVMNRLAKHLVPQGILYASFKYGDDERQQDGRHFTDMTEETFATLLDECPSLRQVDIWRTHDQRPNKFQDIWLNALLKKV